MVTDDGELLEELVGLAAAGGVEVSVAVDAVAAEDHWARAPLVVVGADQIPALAGRDLPRRLGVVLVARSGSVVQGADSDPAASARPMDASTAWSAAEALHAEHVVVLPNARSWLIMRFAECRPRALRHAAPVAAFVSGDSPAGGSLLAAGVACAARRDGLATLLVSVGYGPDATGPIGAAVRCSPPTDPDGANLAVLCLDRGDGTAVPPDAMAAALRAARHGRDLVVVDLPHPYDVASRLALTAADRCYLVVDADVPACTAATRIAAAVRRHCPQLALVVRAVTTRGLRPDEAAEALDLPLAGVLPPDLAVGPAGPVTEDAMRILTALGRRLLAQTGAVRRPGPHRPAPQPGVNEVVDR